MLAKHLAGPEAATNIALRIIEVLDAPIEAGGNPSSRCGHRHHASADDAATSEEALRKADVALYRAKTERRSALRFFELGMDARVLERASLEQGLRTAVDLNAIEPMFLPPAPDHPAGGRLRNGAALDGRGW